MSAGSEKQVHPKWNQQKKYNMAVAGSVMHTVADRLSFL